MFCWTCPLKYFVTGKGLRLKLKIFIINFNMFSVNPSERAFDLVICLTNMGS
jgi:hypothetical protein